jgi:hypothetical protein
MKQLLALSVLLVGFQCASYGDTVSAGTEIQVRPDSPITVAKWERGRIYTGHTDRDVVARDGDVAIPRGARVEMIVRQINDDQLALDIESINVNGKRYAIDTTGPQFNATRQDYDRGAGLVGNIVGAITGAETQGREIRIPSDATLRFHLQQPLRIVTWQDPGYDQNGNHYHRDNDWYR